MYFNKCIFIGRLTREPELRYTASGIPVANFTVAVDRPFVNAQGEREADFIRVVTWRKLAETCANNLGKGRLVLVEGRLQVGTYTDREGIQRKSFDIVADVVRFLDRKKETEGAPAGVPEAIPSSADVPDSGVPSDLPEIDWPEEPPF